ncbi:MAG: GNAT family N-acetyltransferase [Lachnospiraceae bacterium]|nr:GNAT family N-acetyltransferase [Lachnospiraceae bacterium]
MEHKGTKRIETERLILRKFVPEDAEPAFRNWCSDPEVTRYLTWPTHTDVSVTDKIIALWIDGYKDPSFYQWAIVLKEIDEPIGSISIVAVNESVEAVDIGYCIGKKWWHKGIVTEAFRAIIPYLFHEVEVRRIEARHAVKNPHSGGVMKKCGLTYEGILRKSDVCNAGIMDMCYYSILREEYRKSILRGTYNTRDLGGYRTADGRETRYFRILRSNMPSKVTEEDIELLREKGITTIIDMRSSSAEGNETLPFYELPDFRCFNIRIDAANYVPQTVEELPGIYMDIVHSRVLKDIFELIAGAPRGVMINCFAGKDRTGVISALILLLCGVGMDDVMKDYMISDENCGPLYRLIKELFPDVDIEAERPHEWQLEQFFEMFYDEYGSLSGYFDWLGVSTEILENIKSRLLV